MIKDNNFLPEQDTQMEKNRKFYTAQKTTSEFPELLSEEEITTQKEYFSKLGKIPDKYKDKDLKTPEFENGINETKEWIIKFCKEIGFSEKEISNRLNENKDIYVLPEKVFQRIIKDKDSWGYNISNEIFIRNSKTSGSSDKINRWAIQHELIHSACIKKTFLEKEAKESKEVSSGYSGDNNNNNLEAFNEGLVETTNQQLYLENGSVAPVSLRIDEVIFVTELAKDISKKTKLSSREVLTHFQKGMIKGERKYLKIIKDIYGKEALNRLTDMKTEGEDIIKVSKIFNLPKVEEKINDFMNQIRITIDIGDKNYNIKWTKPGLKEKNIRRFKKQLENFF